ncbi:interleukin-27 receptor subunit alpha [Rhinoderma darwinii]|uniref:interleukin-27 receptor subunit alpha n=1 Tax=Rhinoderma darwinii TaxID=43563 RepID=UPI003F67C9F7
MSDRRWIKAFLRGLLILNLSYIYGEGFVHDCSVCCEIQDKEGNLYCSWRSDARTQQFLSLQSLTNFDEPPHLFRVPFGENCLVIPRINLVKFHEYLLTVTGGGKEETLNFIYSNDGFNILISPPGLNSSVSGSESIDIIWDHIEGEELELRPVELRYRIQGAPTWTKVNTSELEVSSYTLDDPVPDTNYEFQIRYLPDEKNEKKGSPWSKSDVITSAEMAPNGSSDVWRSLENGSSLLVMWKSLDHRSARGRILSYMVTYFHGVEELTTEVPCCSTRLPAQTKQVCVRAKNSIGLGPPACAAPLCTEMENVTVFTCKVWGDSTGRMNVLCEELVKSDHVLSYIMEWREEQKTEVHWTRSQTVSETLVLPGDFTPGVLYSISVYLLYNNSCIRTLTTEAYSRDEVPTAAPNFTSHVLSARNVLVSWEEIPRPHRRGVIIHHTIYVKSTNHSERHTVSNGSGNKTLSGLSSGIIYTIWMTASSRAGEGQPSPLKNFQTIGNRHHVFLLMAGVINILFVCGVMLCFCDYKTLFWPKIPNPEDTFKELFMTSNGNMWQPQQVSVNPLVTVIEEIEPPPQPALPPSPPPSPPKPSPLRNKAPAINSGYEKHFMPTPEEVMGLA